MSVPLLQIERLMLVILHALFNVLKSESFALNGRDILFYCSDGSLHLNNVAMASINFFQEALCDLTYSFYTHIYFLVTCKDNGLRFFFYVSSLCILLFFKINIDTFVNNTNSSKLINFMFKPPPLRINHGILLLWNWLEGLMLVSFYEVVC